ncbi:type II secretion system protein [Oryzomonas sagensis]|uniref:Type II secretion system protein n=1 Tax=Oryzomonas sagensis TaxID=2603857 RepID=A0ABQ6TLV9_9BACT|nr:type II secretion system protein [Oryzomonas sagensis]KAB0669006.1 type II secretion system protein [Oryzomonas sagensis]
MSTEQQQPKRGRGKPLGTRKENPREIIMKVALTHDEDTEIREAAAVAGEKPSAFVRSAALARCRNTQGFFLLEAIITITLLGMVAAIGITHFSSPVDQGRQFAANIIATEASARAAQAGPNQELAEKLYGKPQAQAPAGTFPPLASVQPQRPQAPKQPSIFDAWTIGFMVIVVAIFGGAYCRSRRDQ